MCLGHASGGLTTFPRQRSSSAAVIAEEGSSAEQRAGEGGVIEVALGSRSKSAVSVPVAADLEAASVGTAGSDEELEHKPLFLGTAASDAV